MFSSANHARYSVLFMIVALGTIVNAVVQFLICCNAVPFQLNTLNKPGLQAIMSIPRLHATGNAYA